VGSEEIFEYYKGRAEAYGVFDYVRIQHRVNEARWDEKTGKWLVQVEDMAHSRTFTDEAEVLINAGGFLKCVTLLPEVSSLR
jgi:cation diffusion facilitator CzcD-associated flavoprotein CzcO